MTPINWAKLIIDLTYLLTILLIVLYWLIKNRRKTPPFYCTRCKRFIRKASEEHSLEDRLAEQTKRTEHIRETIDEPIDKPEENQGEAELTEPKPQSKDTIDITQLAGESRAA